jgi:hypothetical protein
MARVHPRHETRLGRQADIPAAVAPDDAWAITGGSFTTAGTYGLSHVQVLHWDAPEQTSCGSGGSTSVRS